MCKLKVDAIVNSTNETLNEVNGLSERIFAAAGRDIGQEILALDGCRTGEAKITAGFSLPARCVPAGVSVCLRAGARASRRREQAS